MKDQSRTKTVMIQELTSLRQRVAELERLESDRKRVEEGFKENEERYRLIFENSGEAILFTQPDGAITSANPEACRMFGRSEDEICRLGRAGIVDASDTRLPAALEERRRTGRFRGELRLARKDGTVFPAEVSTNLYLDSRGIERTSMIIRDISDRKQAEEALRSSESTHRFITENMSDVAFIVDMNLRTAYVSPSIEMVLGFTPEERMRQTIYEQLTPKSREIVFEKIAVEMEKEEAGGADLNRSMTMELEYYHKDGSIIKLEVLARGVRDSQGNLTGFHGLGRDVTERRKLEAQLLQARKMEAIEKLASGAAHEIRNPLNIMSLRLQMLEVTGKVVDEDIRRVIHTCREQIDRITQVLDGLHDFSHIPETRKTRDDLNKIIKSVTDSCGAQFRNEGITADILLGEDIPLFMLDREKMTLVLRHLISNAADAMRGRETRRLAISTEKTPTGKSVCVIISDTGHGIREADLPRIFDPFFTTREPGKGKGLGMAIAYGIVRDHGGTIRAENRDEGGATFIIELPTGETNLK
jgi:PAS domain S-box-containing protein